MIKKRTLGMPLWLMQVERVAIPEVKEEIEDTERRANQAADVKF